MLVLASVALLCYDSFMIKPSSQRRLNIFIDETGEFGFSGKSAKYYGISLVIHEQDKDITKEIDRLQQKFNELDFDRMFHIGDLIYGHGDYENMTIKERKKIYFAMYLFMKNIDVKYYSSFYEKKYSQNTQNLQRKIKMTLSDFINNHITYFQQFNRIVVYYDGGQSRLSNVIEEVFMNVNGYERRKNFNHLEKKLFQVADSLTFVDKLIFKYDNHLKFNKSERAFFPIGYIKMTKRAINSKRMDRTSKIRKAPFRAL